MQVDRTVAEVIKVRVLLEGVEFPYVASIQVMNSPTSTRCNIAVPSSKFLKAEQIVGAKLHIFWSDSKIRRERSNRDWPLLFQGQLSAESSNKSLDATHTNLTFVGHAKYYDQAKIYFYDPQQKMSVTDTAGANTMAVYMGSTRINIDVAGALSRQSRLRTVLDARSGNMSSDAGRQIAFLSVLLDVLRTSSEFHPFLKYISSQLKLNKRFAAFADPDVRKVLQLQRLQKIVDDRAGALGPNASVMDLLNIVANLMQAEGIQGFDIANENDVLLGVLPFYHIYGMVVIMNMSLVVGATIVTIPRFDPEMFLGLIQKHKVTRINLVPPILLLLAKHPIVDKFDLSSLVDVTSGAAPLKDELAQAVVERIGCNVMQGYGLTETSPVTHINPNLPGHVKRSSIGPAIPNTEVMLIDPANGEPVGRNEEGELWVRGPQVMKGYLNNPDATAATVDEDGWLHTGDIGYIDEDGDFYIVDRLKELIKYKGFQVAPAELEGLLLGHPAVGDAAVIPSPDDEAGELPKAFIVRKAEVSEQEIMDWVAERVAPQKKIRLVEFVDEVPKSASGKILRRVLVEQERAKNSS